MATDTLKTARERVQKLYGQHLAQKASDDFCLAFGLPLAAVSFGLETAAGPPGAQSAVLEFAADGTVAAVREQARKLRRHKAWEDLRKAAAGLRELDLPLQAAQMLRQAKVQLTRDVFYKHAGAIRDEVERGARGFARPGPETLASPNLPSAVTQVCWLNRAVRTWVDARLLAEVAADPRVKQIDLPRRLEADLHVTAQTVGAVAHRQKFSVSGKNIVVAVIDSEVSANHPALTGRVIHKKNYSRELWGNPGAHGTAVAGIIAARSNDLDGIAPDATIYNYKVLATNRFLNGDDFDGALALQQALEDGAHIANCSWGAGPASDGTSREARACDAAWALGLAVVKSAGNRGPGAGTLTTPADASGVIVVGATDQTGKHLQDYSSRGPTPHSKKRPHFVAPGGTLERGIDSCLVGGGFGDCGAGTSYAAPHVAGMLALILEQKPDATPDELRAMLLGACAPFAPNDDNLHGKGLVSLARLS